MNSTACLKSYSPKKSAELFFSLVGFMPILAIYCGLEQSMLFDIWSYNRRLVSSVGRVKVCCAGGRGFEPGS